jgi:hypothetical protein
MTGKKPTTRDLGLEVREDRRTPRGRAERVGHDMTCWRHHPECALRRARDIERNRRDHAAGRAQLYADTAARAAHMDPLTRWRELGTIVAEAREVLEGEWADSEARRDRAAGFARRSAG